MKVKHTKHEFKCMEIVGSELGCLCLIHGQYTPTILIELSFEEMNELHHCLKYELDSAGKYVQEEEIEPAYDWKAEAEKTE